MIGTFKIDQAATFDSAHLMSVEPKNEFKSDDQQTAKDGTPKWQAKVVVRYQLFGRSESEVISVNLTSRNDPGANIPPVSAIELVGFEVNVSEKKNRDNSTVPGITQWYRADEIKVATAPAAGKSAKAEA